MCGSCYSPLTDIVNVLFFSCRWSYSGRLISGEKRRSSQEQKASGFEYFPGELQELSWRWLKFSIGEERGVRRMLVQGAQTQSSEPACSSVQTDLDSSSHTETHVIDEELVDTLLATEKHYQEKYRKLKQDLSQAASVHR